MTITFDHLDDPLDNLFNGGATTDTNTPARSPVQPPANYRPPYFEACPKCRGTGQTRWGVCFRCKGKKGKSFKQPAAVRAAKREGKANRKARSQAEAIADWGIANPEPYAYMVAKAPTFRIMADLLAKLAQWGSLTEGQLAMVQRFMEQDKTRTAAVSHRGGAAKAAPIEIDVSKIQAAFDHARTAAAKGGDRVKWLRLTLGTYTFVDMPAKAQWKAAILVKDGEAKLGRIEAGKLNRFPACTDGQLAQVIAIAADPFTAAKAHGQAYKFCACCGRELTNAVSRELGIGPVCARRFGWAAVGEGD